ncbi:metallopeptidase TldD-related protein [Bulleidia sp. zg-1006]|uniref:metallopeptidase TldD-related protein n=1 Tax=Bulleidia sp. zg-1006 TaxID=2806552 RepID=UPI00193A4079|nr:metallopeptidase TldD-related protein [Bulleidia sp. zg-1006]QRG87189.1 TldD/PmbA family protein [Bulleidia sp. zg-1006]
MLELIKKSLKELGISIWEIQERTSQAWEFYFIKHALDQHRIRDVKHTDVTVYVGNEDGSLGNAGAEVPPFSSEEEILSILKELKERAGYVHNKSYSLVSKSTEGFVQKVDLKQISKDFISTVQSIPEDEEKYINSYEIFVEEKRDHYINSNGVDVQNVYPSSMLEIILNARKGNHEIELYRNYKSGTCDKDFLQKDIQKVLQQGKDRLSTVPTPALEKMPILFSNENVVTLFQYYKVQMNAQALLSGASSWKSGEEICKDVKGDKVTIQSLSKLNNSSYNASVDQDGSALGDCVLLEDNIPRKFIGSRRYASYVGLEDTFIPKNYYISGGTYDEEELRKGDYLEVIEFSDFQMNPINGDFGGEIRLAYLHKDGKIISVTGGSLSDNWLNQIQNLKLSKESTQYNDNLVPSLVLLPGAMVTGVEHE